MKINDYGFLFRGITSNVNLFISSKIEKYGIRQGQFEYFLLIFSSPGINQLELARRKNVGKASVTKALKILEDDGFIRRTADDKDKRNFLCYITEKGEKIVKDLMDVRANTEADIFEGLTDEDKSAFYNYLTKIYHNSEKLVSGLTMEGQEE